MSIYFKDGAFYLDQFNESIPEDALEIIQEDYDALFEGQANGQMIVTGSDGKPALQEKPLPSHDVLVSLAEQNRQSLINSAMQSVSALQLKLQAGRKLTADETSKLNAVLDYIDAVNAVNVSTAPEIEWPQRVI
ncbi:tail fiber assembly protein [Klebsiella pneumoniae]|uniref:tail fiber assembly protein n=1 Tax=Klebsiella pneumoniae TaxID=573 RepID=UPI000807BE8F|nr:tail fiber assembly protein [Klebsiella pneumoniae]MDP1341535.1 tail fiber assembly protein [Klebsiella pneumoniae]MDZ2672078.1 tail fiber assembly protein [Klebsiella pneumoniae]SBW52993.1 Caudovirales tail fibre assembly protein [Klebsiella pneumoniae]HDU2707427.1 tail fiber assembly protein [Klebsiella pneumoniae]